MATPSSTATQATPAVAAAATDRRGRGGGPGVWGVLAHIALQGEDSDVRTLTSHARRGGAAQAGPTR